MKHLPTELIGAILQEAQSDDCLPRCRWLRNYSLVCRNWCSYAQGFLFQQVILLGGAMQASQLLASLSGVYSKDPQHTDFLRKCIRTMVVGMDHQSVYAEVILLCPNLEDIDVRLHHASFRPDILSQLGGGVPKLEALHLRSTFWRPMYQLLEVWSPKIKYLSLNVRYIEPMYFKPLWSLRELRLFCPSSVASELLSWILSGPNCRDTVEILHLDSFVHSNQLHEIPQAVLSTVRSFHVGNIAVEDMEHLSSLEEFAIKSGTPSKEVLSLLPTTVHHLLLPCVKDCLEGVVGGLSAYQQRSGNALRVLTYTRAASEPDVWEEEDVRELQAFCHLNNVEFRFMHPPYGSITGEREPLGHIPRHFPRNMPLSKKRRPILAIQDSQDPTDTAIRPSKKKMIHKVARFARAQAAMIIRGSTHSPLALARP